MAIGMSEPMPSATDGESSRGMPLHVNAASVTARFASTSGTWFVKGLGIMLSVTASA